MTEKPHQHKYQKIKRITKQDRIHINSILDIALNPTSDKWIKNQNWIKLLQNINIDSLCRSLSQILNAEFDYLPQQLIMNNPNLAEIKNDRRSITIMDVLANSDTIFRFAPSPSGYLHIGHFVPLLLNILLRSISFHYGKRSKLILRIDDTNPNEDDFSSEIKKTLQKIMNDSFDDMIETRSSILASKVIHLIDNSIMNTYDDKFYVDLSDQKIIRMQRNVKKNSTYREMTIIEQRALWNKMKSGELTNAVVRAKIDIQSDNGNLRDPVMLRYVKHVDKIIMMPTYDLVCPVLDSLDSIENSNDKSILIAMRDCNYYDRLDQYIWIQNALQLKPTAIVTFARISFDNIILSKRKIKKLITMGAINSWDDLRIMNIDGVFNRGITLQGLLNFYWLSGHISTGNRSTTQDIMNLFDINDKVLSQWANFIMDREKVSFKLTNEIDTYMIISINACVLKSNATLYHPSQNRNKGKFLINSLSDDNNTNDNIIDNTTNIYDEDEHITENDLTKLPNIVHVTDVFCKKNKLITNNLRHIIKLSLEKNLNDNDLDHGFELISKYSLPSNKFKICSDVSTQDIIKINNYKDDPSEPIFGGYYYVTKKYKKQIENLYYDAIDVLFIN